MKNIYALPLDGALLCLAYYVGSVGAYTIDRCEMEDRHQRLAVPVEARMEQHELLKQKYEPHAYGALGASGICVLASLGISVASSIQERKKQKSKSRYLNDLFK